MQPFATSSFLLSRAVSSQVPSAFGCLTSVFGMGTGGSIRASPLDILFSGRYPQNYTEARATTFQDSFYQVKPSVY